MPTVTGTLSDIGLEDLSPFNPVLIFRPSNAAVASDGHVFAGKPVEVTPAADGTFSATLATTDNVKPTSTRWLCTIGWRDQDGYDTGLGRFQRDVFAAGFRVPAEGGALADLIDLPPATSEFYIGTTPPPDGSGYRYWIDISGTDPVLKEWSA